MRLPTAIMYFEPLYVCTCTGWRKQSKICMMKQRILVIANNKTGALGSGVLDNWVGNIVWDEIQLGMIITFDPQVGKVRRYIGAGKD
jgi:hypothetical protein